MGNENSANHQIKQVQHIDDSITNQFLKQFQQYQGHDQIQIKSLSHGGNLAIFERKVQAFTTDDQNHKEMVSLNYQSVCKQKFLNELQSMKSHINYYKKRIELALDPDTDTVSSIVRLHHFTIRNEATNELIYPESKEWKLLGKNQAQTKQKGKKMLPSCGFDNIFTRRQPDSRQPSITSAKKQIYAFSFLQELNMDSLQKQILFRRDSNQCFRQKEIWSIIYCCCKAASKMILSGLKEPVLSPGAIFINEKCEIKVSQWEFVNYYFAFREETEREEGEAILASEMDVDMGRENAQENIDILVKYYWPPEGLVEMQNILGLGELQTESNPVKPTSESQRQKQAQRQKLYEAKNGQVFCLGMTLLQLLTLKPYYQKTTYSEKQLSRLVQEAIQVRQCIDQPMSQQMVDLLMEMLQWDPMERFRYSDIIEYIHQVFEDNQMIFGEETSRVNIPVRTVRSQIDGSEPTDSQTHRAPKLDINRVTQVTVSNRKPSARRSAKFTPQPYNNENISKQLYKQDSNARLILIDEDVEVRIDRLEDSGVMWPGKGDDYSPNEENEEQERRLPFKAEHYAKTSVKVMDRKCLRPLRPDYEDAPQLSQELYRPDDVQNPDEDVDYEGQQLDQKHQQTLLSQQKRYIESFNINPLNSIQSQYLPQQFSVYQYIPKHWPSIDKSLQSRQTLKEKQLNTSQSINELNLSRDSFASFNLKFLNKSSEDINFKKNISFDPLFVDSNNKFASPPQNLYVNNLSTIVKETQSPQLQKITNKENILSFQTHNSNLFTSQNIMEMIREFTKKQSQQTPDFNTIQLTNQKHSLKNDIKNHEASKKLTFQDNPSFVEKKFDKCFGSTLFDSSYDRLFTRHQLEKDMENKLQTSKGDANKFNKSSTQKTPTDPIVRIQFAKGTYEGTIKNSLRNGYGTFYYKQGGKYSGYWYNNKMDGHGTLYYPDGRVAYEGQWQNDSLHGKGILYNENPVKIQGKYDFRSFQTCDQEQCWVSYDGWFENDDKCGFGELLLSNSEKYVGEFRTDMVDGKGKFYKLDGTLFEGFWKQNRLVCEEQ